MNSSATPTILITPRGLGGLAEWCELWAARDLWWFLVRRDLKTRYAQSVLGLGWAVIQPLMTMGVFTLVFGKIAELNSDGAPYPIWSLTAVVLWTFFQTAVIESGNSLAANVGVITKVYFPRFVLPLAGVAGKLFDLAIMMVLLLVVIAANSGNPGVNPQFAAFWAVPAALAVTALAALALGLWLAALSVQYRDVRVAQGFLLQLLMYGSPVIYSSNTEKIPETLRWLYFCNPLAGAIEATRSTLLGVAPQDSLTLTLHLLQGLAVAFVALLGGLWCFRRAEQIVADVA